MSGRITIWGAGQMLTMFFSNVVEHPDNFYLALVRSVPPTQYVSASELDEPPADSGYSRAVIPNSGYCWHNASQPYVVTNTETVTFTTPTNDWGPLRYWALCNSDVEGYIYIVGELEEPMTVLMGDTVILPEGSVTINLGPFFSGTD